MITPDEDQVLKDHAADLDEALHADAIWLYAIDLKDVSPFLAGRIASRLLHDSRSRYRALSMQLLADAGFNGTASFSAGAVTVTEASTARQSVIEVLKARRSQPWHQ